MSLSLSFDEASHAEPFEPVERLEPDRSKAGTREAGRFRPAAPELKKLDLGLPFSPQRDASDRALIDERAAKRKGNPALRLSRSRGRREAQHPVGGKS